jgi:hypothetical protein
MKAYHQHDDQVKHYLISPLVVPLKMHTLNALIAEIYNHLSKPRSIEEYNYQLAL